ncbi:putative endothelin-converting enzyme 1 [Medicago truncatula]|uniref:EEF1A lysine methyltransferase 4 n=1 Tax=Medicago truncatula TaxID=3880 RepID=A0A072UMY8_MEDTR|nr:EEF1A lysine methyltransferase 4 [Medicago truncatula]KEH30388.1 S-adenosylmethionine-dependent methyltransferase, putative [Medicago truncatula]RHN61232.1 putative endothelin-converting enzyme 1 [Medicago truncatula]
MDETHPTTTATVEPSSASAYLNPSYWDERFSKEEKYEWFKEYSHFRHIIQPHLTPNSSVLELGCGNSQMCDGLYNDGTTNITCIDLSHVAVHNMQNRLLSQGFKDIKVMQADMLELPFDDECFDLVIEKGTMDVLFVDSGDPWNPKPETMSKVMSTLKGVHRVLKPDGIFISITFGQPHFRRPIFNAPDFSWSVEWTTFGETFHYFVYVLKKGQRSSHEDIPPVKRIEVPHFNLFHEELESEDFAFRINVDELNS